MSKDEKEIRQILWRYLDGDLAAADEKRVARLLQEQPGAVRMLYELTDEKLLMDEALSEKAEAVALRSLPARRSARLRLAVPLAIAAGIAAAVAAAWWMGGKLGSGRWQGASGKGVVIARVTEARGEVTADFADSADKKMLKVGAEVRVGDKITVGEGGRVRLAYEAGATVELDADSILVMPEAGLISQISPLCLISKLEKGSLTAHVEKRSALDGKPFAIETPHARVEVLGTRFTLRVQRSEVRGQKSEESAIRSPQSAINTTWLQVESGLVRFTRLVDGEAIEVAAGHFAVAGAKAEHFALKTYPAGTEWVDGPVIFRDDFEKGLGNWELVAQGEDDVAFRPVPGDSDKHMRIEDGMTGRCAVIRSRGLSERCVGIRLRIPIECDAFALEFQERSTKGRHYGYSLGFKELISSKVLFRSPRHGRMALGITRFRKEYIPFMDSSGREGLDFRLYREGEMMFRALVDRRCGSIVIACRETRVAEVDNVIIRKLVPKNGEEE